MNEEYLWSKEGSDSEIERLETLLSDLRFKQGPPPELVADNIIQVKPQTGRRFAWLAAFSATATAAVLFEMCVVKTPEPQVAKAEASQIQTLPDDKPLKTPPTEFAKVSEPEHLPGLKTVRAPRFVKTVYRTHESGRAAGSSTIAQKTKLTKEEKYAYDRLMLALSITGSKLKIVQDTIDRKSYIDQASIRNDK